MAEPIVDALEVIDVDEQDRGRRAGPAVTLDRIKQKFPAEQVFYTKILEEVDPTLVKWKSKTDVK